MPQYSDFYRVSGERKEYVLDKETQHEVLTGKVLPLRTRFECLELKNAEAFASDVYRRESIICEIHQVSRP